MMPQARPTLVVLRVDRRRRRTSGARPAVLILAAAAMALGGIVGGAWFGEFRINLTPSEPIGLWRIEPLDRPAATGDLVFICPPVSVISEFGMDRGYFRTGLCPSGTAPLIKTVAAVSGAHVDIGKDLTIDGTPLPSSRLSPRDGAGRALVPWSGGIVPAGYVFLHSPFAGSYDSRYFGPIPAAGVLGAARPVLTWKP